MANGGVQKKSQENVGGAKNPCDIRTDDLLDLDVSNCHIYIVAKVWDHSTQVYINECNRNKALCFFPCVGIKMNLKEGSSSPLLAHQGVVFPTTCF